MSERSFRVGSTGILYTIPSIALFLPKLVMG